MRTPRLLIVGTSKEVYELRAKLLERGFFCGVAYENEVFQRIIEQVPDIILMELNLHTNGSLELIESIKREKSLPVIVLLRQTSLDKGLLNFGFDDFIIEPYREDELELRIERLRTGAQTEGENPEELIVAGDLVIDQAKCEVTIAGRPVILAFKEYELLIFLVNNSGRVFTRQVLLDKVWGYDYFGGERTVDVHIRRLRAKIEDSKHSFIDTVRSIGYRFKKNTP